MMKSQFRTSLLMSALLLLFGYQTHAQDKTHEGTDFWVAFTDVYDAESATFQIHISSRTATTGMISIKEGKFRKPFKVSPGKVNHN